LLLGPSGLAGRPWEAIRCQKSKARAVSIEHTFVNCSVLEIQAQEAQELSTPVMNKSARLRLASRWRWTSCAPVSGLFWLPREGDGSGQNGDDRRYGEFWVKEDGEHRRCGAQACFASWSALACCEPPLQR
jgi:hypothetical protein